MSGFETVELVVLTVVVLGCLVGSVLERQPIFLLMSVLATWCLVEIWTKCVFGI